MERAAFRDVIGGGSGSGGGELHGVDRLEECAEAVDAEIESISMLFEMKLD